MMEDDAVQEDEAAGEYNKWINEISVYDQEASKWVERGKKIVKRYKDERLGAVDKRGAKYNVLWSNVQTMGPAVYNSPPKPNIERRSRDQDDVGRVASEVLERSASYFIDKDNFDSVMKQAVQDRLLPGRGTGWVRYVASFKAAPIDVDDEPAAEEMESEEVCVDYVHWTDFGHSVAKTWEEVDAVWRIAYLDRDALIKRFGEEVGNEIPLDYVPRKLDGVKLKEATNKAAIYEIWCKKTKTAYWLSKSYPKMLDSRDDPLGLEDFFPCPKPVLATTTTDSLIPVADYYLYQDQATELDDLTARISQIMKALKVAGVYDASAQGVQRLLAEGVENQLIPVEQWALFAEKGGIKGVVDFMPMKEIMETLLGLYEARDRVKADLYEITGMSDIIRGATDPDETFGAQKLKGQYANLRLTNTQKDVARFGRDLMRIMVEIIAEHFSLDTIKNISGLKLLTAQEKQQINMQLQQQQAMAQQAAQQGMQAPPPPPLDDEMQELLDGPTWEDVEGLLRNQEIRSYRIDIETDSTIKADEEAEKASRLEFLNAASGFIQQAMQVQDPALKPLMMQMLMFGVRSFKSARELEGEFELTMKKIRKEAENPAPPPEDPAIKADQMKQQLEMQRQQMEMQQKEKDNAIQMQIAQMDSQTKLQISQNESQVAVETERLKTEQETIKAQAALLTKQNEPAPAPEPKNVVINYDRSGNKVA